MPLNSSGPISIGGSTTGQSINLELGRSATAQSNLNETALRTLAGVPSGAISLSNFYGKSNVSFPFVAIGVSGTSYAPNDATSGFTMNRNGTITDYAGDNTSSNLPQDWISPKSSTVGDGYWVRVTRTGGTRTAWTGSPGSGWFQLNTDRLWYIVSSSADDIIFTIELATDSGGTNIVKTVTNNYCDAFGNQ